MSSTETSEKFVGPDIITIAKGITTLDQFEDKYAENVRTCSTTGKSVTLCYNEFGDPKNPLFIMLAGLGCQAPSLETCVCKWLVNQGYYVIRFDHRDVGLSTKFDDIPQDLPALRLLLPERLSFRERLAYPLTELAEDAVALMRFLGHSKAHWAGISMGGMVAQLIAISHPDVVRSLVLIMTTSGTLVKWPPLSTIYGLLAPKPMISDPVERLRNTMKFVQEYLVGHYLLDTSIALQGGHESIKRSTYDAGTPRHLAAIVRSPPRDASLKNLKLPTLVLHGKLDRLAPFENGKHLHELIPDSDFFLYPEMGHYIDFDHLQLVYERIVQHMRAADT